jgi:transglutaminase-like putative cysteine protease
VALPLTPVRQFAARDSLLPLARLLPVAVAGIASGLAFHPLFGYQPVIKPVVTATLIPLLLAAVPAAVGRRIPLAAYQVISAGLWLLTADLMLFAGAPGSALSGVTLSAVGAGAVNGWAQLLTIALPAPPQPGLLVIPFTLTWVAVTAGAELVLRTRVVVAAMLPALVALAVALAFSVPGSGSNLPEGVVFTGSALGALLLENARRGATAPPASASADLGEPAQTDRIQRIDRGRRLRVGFAAVASMLAVTVLAAVAAPAALSGRAAADPRSYWPVPVRPVAQLDPLNQVAGWLARPGQPLFLAQSGSSEPWQFAVLDQYDGEQWTSSDRFTPLGVGPIWPAGAGQGAVVHADLRITGLNGSLIPTAGRPVSVDNPGLSVDTSTGMLLSDSQLRSGTEFAVNSMPTTNWPAADLAGLTAASGPATAADLRLPGKLPTALYALPVSALKTGTAGSAYQEAALLEQYLLRNFANDPKSPAGAAVGDLEQFLTSRTGTTVQFAEAFTLAARILRLPSRLMVGFTAGSRAGGTRAHRIDGGDVLVWSEVDFTGVGWLPFFPTPKPSSKSTHPPDGPALGETAAEADAMAAALQIKPRPVVGEPNPGRVPAPSSSRLLLWVAFTLVVVAALAHAALFFLAPRIRRHRRRTRGTPEQRVAEAWRDLIEQLARMREKPLPGDSNSAIANRAIRASGQRGMRGAAQLSQLVTAAQFDPSASVSDTTAADAWRYRDAIRVALRDAAAENRRLRVRSVARFGSRLLGGHRGETTRRPGGVRG